MVVFEVGVAVSSDSEMHNGLDDPHLLVPEEYPDEDRFDSLVAKEAPQEGKGVWQPGPNTEKGLKYNAYWSASNIDTPAMLLPEKVHARLMGTRPSR